MVQFCLLPFLKLSICADIPANVHILCDYPMLNYSQNATSFSVYCTAVSSIMTRVSNKLRVTNLVQIIMEGSFNSLIWTFENTVLGTALAFLFYYYDYYYHSCY